MMASSVAGPVQKSCTLPGRLLAYRSVGAAGGVSTESAGVFASVGRNRHRYFFSSDAVASAAGGVFEVTREPVEVLEQYRYLFVSRLII